MGKNIVILFDGTSNQITEDRTNILRLYGMLEKSDRQLVYYDPGVGTLGVPDSWGRLWPRIVEFWGLATGWGLDRNVKQAYQFLVDNYERGGGGADRDRIYLFGFSRGAYTARVLAGFINAVGLIERRNLNLLDYVYRAYKLVGSRRSSDDDEERPGVGEEGTDKARNFAEVRLYERVLRPDRPPIRLLGLFDTVASVIESGPKGPRLRSHAYTRHNPSVEAVRHAVAIDERRTMFTPQLWPVGAPYWAGPFKSTDAPAQDVREVWFAGVHGDVGGGYPELESGLCKVPLEWMIEQTGPTGLHYVTRTVNAVVLGKRADQRYVKPDPLGEPHHTMTGLWPLLEFVPRRRSRLSRRPALFGWTLPLFERRVIPEGAMIHGSVAERIARDGASPPNLPADHVVEGGSW
ncbi:T6SS phospholipase effector Tle1-like catalytic domain-containing protein [Sphingobium nicotianae]|uniref:DUF2235 domain-containing protein n=1 Tax=Sphingobium nicotianae TaxID=2782607 RepID=A0A9X1AJM2_9SPHN|nr:DUF2235 domain-containing protein [Sphingobium nicotianae]MBT2185393.1 DUF2235 domain-containing protein [Sphingobium nicotianae]